MLRTSPWPATRCFLGRRQSTERDRAPPLLRRAAAITAVIDYVDGATLLTLLRQRPGRGVRDLRADLR